MSRLTTPRGRGMGWKRQHLDRRDLQYAPRPATLRALAPTGDLEPGMPDVYDQLQEGSCTANGGAATFDYVRKAQGLPFIYGSRNFLYWNTRSLEGSTGSDAGAEIRDVPKALGQWGIPPETEYPYSDATLLKKPPKQDYKDALANKAVKYEAVQQTSDAILGALAENHPVLIGFEVFNEYENLPASGIVPMPTTRESALGGHCNVLCGWDTTRARYPDILVKSRNSWGATQWGPMGGYCWFPMAYLLNQQLSSDFWIIDLVTPEPSPTPPTPTPAPSTTFNVGPGVVQALSAAGLAPASDEQPLNHDNSNNGWLSLTAASDGSLWAYMPSLGQVKRVG